MRHQATQQVFGKTMGDIFTAFDGMLMQAETTIREQQKQIDQLQAELTALRNIERKPNGNHDVPGVTS